MRILYRKKIALFTPVKFGFLYNNYAVTNAKVIAPAGWHLPSVAEWNTLITFVGGQPVAGGKLKETGTVYFNAPNTGATNEFGFNGRGGGARTAAGFATMLGTGYFQTSYFWNGVSNRVYSLKFNYATTDDPGVGRTEGYSARLICDSGTDPGVMVGNDGKRYRTKKIGTQVWMADNLAETKYRDGSNITLVTDQTAWNALVTEGYCAFNNDNANV